MADGYLTKRAAARWLDVSEKTIDRLRAAGELEALKLSDGPGGRGRISAASENPPPDIGWSLDA